MKKEIAIIGGGIAGASLALYLSKLGLSVTLFEKKKSLVDGPPICHLHAGGNLYREISDEQCITLLKESIELIQLYPCAVDFRPTVIAVPVEDSGEPQDLYARLERLKNEYAKLIEEDSKNRVLGSPDEYYKLYSKEQLEELQKREPLTRPISFDEWMIPVVKTVDLSKVKFPLIMVQEYGLNIFRLAATTSLSLQNTDAKLLLNTYVSHVTKEGEGFLLEYKMADEPMKSKRVDFLINAAGFKSGEIDDMLGFYRERFVEFKAAYVTKWKSDAIWPELIFYGERGTPQGMAQFTPYPDGYFQLHGMTEEITLFEDGLVKSHKESAQPQLSQKYLNKIYKGWCQQDVEKRSKLAIEHLCKFIPNFCDAKVAAKPLYGAQQIPGGDATLRAANVSFEGKNYARCEIVKASSVLSVADAVTLKLIELNFIEKNLYKKRVMNYLREEDVTSYAEALCAERGYPTSMAQRYNNSLIL